MSDQKTIKDIINGHRLPTLPTVAARRPEMTAEDDIDIRRIAEVVQMDQAPGGQGPADRQLQLLRTVPSLRHGASGHGLPRRTP